VILPLRVVEPVLQRDENAPIYYINMSSDTHKLGGSSFAQTQNKIGDQCPSIVNSSAFAKAFTAIQNLIKQGKVLAGHDVASGGLITTLLEMCFPSLGVGMDLDMSSVGTDMVQILFAENAGVVLQVTDESVETELLKADIPFYKLGNAIDEAVFPSSFYRKIT